MILRGPIWQFHISIKYSVMLNMIISSTFYDGFMADRALTDVRTHVTLILKRCLASLAKQIWSAAVATLKKRNYKTNVDVQSWNLRLPCMLLSPPATGGKSCDGLRRGQRCCGRLMSFFFFYCCQSINIWTKRRISRRHISQILTVDI